MYNKEATNNHEFSSDNSIHFLLQRMIIKHIQKLKMMTKEEQAS